jgi:hypothetical protein
MAAPLCIVASRVSRVVVVHNQHSAPTGRACRGAARWLLTTSCPYGANRAAKSHVDLRAIVARDASVPEGPNLVSNRERIRSQGCRSRRDPMSVATVRPTTCGGPGGTGCRLQLRLYRQRADPNVSEANGVAVVLNPNRCRRAERSILLQPTATRWPVILSRVVQKHSVVHER